MPHVTISFDEGVATLTLDRPPQNRIDAQMVNELDAAITAIVGSDARSLLLCSTGENFSFGSDITD